MTNTTHVNELATKIKALLNLQNFLINRAVEVFALLCTVNAFFFIYFGYTSFGYKIVNGSLLGALVVLVITIVITHRIGRWLLKQPATYEERVAVEKMAEEHNVKLRKERN
jgi:multisubunit Na+/H+ antiporter MnhG subunit